MASTALVDIDLRRVHGLHLVRHFAPSAIGIDTLYRSKGEIPKIFLKGAGVEEEFLELTKGWFDKVIQFFSCFISYNHVDRSLAQRLHDQLQAQGIRCSLHSRSRATPG